MAVDTSIIGRETGRARVQVERAPIANFAKAVKDDNPLYSDSGAAKAAGFDGAPAPPTFGFALEFWGRYPDLQQGLAAVQGNPMMEVIGKLMQNGGVLLPGGEGVEEHRPVRAGGGLRRGGKGSGAH